MSGQILTWEDHTADRTLTCDVCIVGSGAGGAVLAAGLCEAGLSVVMLEEGSHMTRADFNMQEGDMMPAMYQERGTRSTSDLAITILQGRSVGGSTTVNWTTCFRPPERILEHWRTEHGIDNLDLAASVEAVESRLNIGPWPGALANPNNQALSRGCEALGWEWGSLHRNVKGCANSGYCGLGCPVDGKQAMGITYLADAVADGLLLLANVSVERLETAGRRVVTVHARAMSPGAGAPDGVRITVKPKVMVSSAGAINGPALLLRSGIDVNGRVGKRTFLHPVVGCLAQYAEPINPFYGAPQSMGSHAFIDRGPDKVGYFLEAAPLQPMLASTAATAFGDELHGFMAKLPYTNALISLSVDGLLPGDEGGTVSVRSDGRVALDYPIGPQLQESFQHATKSLARIQLAAGAQLVASGHQPQVTMRSEADLAQLDSRSYGAHDIALFTAHQMGGCAMGVDAARSVVDTDHRVRGYDNLFVVDGSVLPTALGVNPSETIYVMSHRARAFVGEAV